MATMKATKATDLELDKFADSVIKDVYKSLKARGYSINSVTGKLYKSVRFTINQRKKVVSFYYVDYGEYLDQSSKYHSRVKGHKGTRTLGWFSDPFNKVLKKFPAILEQAIANDLEARMGEIDKNSR